MESLRPSEAELEILVIASCENSFSRFTQKRKVLELRLVINANINSGIAVILSPKSSPYDLQKLSWNFRLNCVVQKRFFVIYAKTEGPRA